MTHTTTRTAYFNFMCCGDNEFQATYSQGKLVEVCCTTCGSVAQVARNI